MLTNFYFVLSQKNFNYINKQNGLPHNNVECVFKDSDGFMWFGTRNGLCRFDGYDIVVFRTSSDKHSISGNRILTINEDNKGYLWIGTYQNGLSRFNKETSKFIRYDTIEGIGDQINKINILSDGSIGVCSNKGLAFYNVEANEFEIYSPNESDYSLNSDIVSDIIETSEGKIYVATWNNEIQLFNRKTKEFHSIKYTDLDETTINYRKRILEDNKGNLWISAFRHGLCMYNPKTGNSKLFKKSFNELNTEVLNGDMILTPDGHIWISTDGNGINIINTDTYETEYLVYDRDNEKGLPGNNVYSLYIDDNERIWLGFFDKGVAYFDPSVNKFSNQSLAQNIINFFKKKSVLSLFQDSKDNIWIGTDGNGLHKLDKNYQLTSYYRNEKELNSVSADVITCIGEDQKGNLYFGTYAEGLNILEFGSQSFKRLQNIPGDQSSLHSGSVWSFLADSENKIWLGLLGMGADIYNDETGTFKNIGPFSNELIKIDHPNVMCIEEDSDGDIWFGTEGKGIFIYDKQAGKLLRLSPEGAKNITTEGIIETIFQDKWGEIWIGTEGRGLFKYNKQSKQLSQYSEKDGLPGMIILGILEDRSDNIWVTTYDGIAKLNKEDNTFNGFNTFDGLSSNEYNANSFIELNDGRFMAGSKNGIDIFDPLNLQFNESIPKVVITKLKILNKDVKAGSLINNRKVLENDISYTKEIELTYSDKSFSLEFAALNFTHPEKCRYQYMLEGFDEDWIDVSYKRRYVSYSNLKNGTYFFKVKASNNDGIWGENITELKIRVFPPYWKAWWFIGFNLLILFGILFAFFYFRMRLIKNRFLHEQALKEMRIVELEKENVESELEKLTFYSVYRNRLLINYKNRLTGLYKKAKESVKKGLLWVIDEIDKEIADDKEWKYLEPRLDKLYKGFISKLRDQHPNLTLSEIKVASYVRMNLSSKEISELMHKTVKAVENDRYRLRKKIKMESNESLANYLLNL